jgi:hypothetical protein
LKGWGQHAVMPVASTPDESEDGTDEALGGGFAAAVLDLLDVLAERGDRLGLDDDAALRPVAQAVERWVAARWAQTSPQDRPALVVDAVRVALVSRAPGHPGPDNES